MEVNRLDEIANLVVKYLRDELTAEEFSELEQWRKESQRHEEEFHRLCSEDFLKEQRQREMFFSVVAAEKRFSTEIRKSLRRRRMLCWTRTVAACILLISGAVLYFRGGQETVPEAVAIACGGARARLTLGNGEIVELEGKTGLFRGEEGVVLNIGKDVLQYIGQGKTEKEEYNTLEIPRKGEYKVILSDGSQVWLNSESVLRYPQTFAGNERHVYLSGEAYFEVSHCPEQPFIVYLNEGEKIKVLGTSFNIQAYRDEKEIYTTLVEGKVSFESGERQLSLFEGEQVVLNTESHSLTKRKVDVRPYIAWKEGRFVFRRVRLEEIMKMVARWYDVEVRYEDEMVKDISFSGNVLRYEDFDKIIAMLEMTRMVDFKVENKRISISKIK